MDDAVIRRARNALDDICYVFNRAGEVMFVNDAASTVTGHSADELEAGIHCAISLLRTEIALRRPLDIPCSTES